MARHQTPAKPVAIYARISKDRAGRAEGVQAQEKWGREYIKEHWPRANVVVFADNDLSAADENVYRPAFEELRQAIRREEIGGLWAVEQSRLTRLEVVWFGLAADLVAARIDEVHTRRDGIVQVGDEVAGIKAVLSAGETRRIRKRVRDKHLALAAEGRPSGPAGYGYRNAKDEQGRAIFVIEPSEAKIVQEIAKRILRGDSLISIGEDLQRRKVPTARGGTWRWNTLTAVVTKPQVAGLRQHNGEPPVKATWEPILDRRTWEKVCALLRTKEREVNGRDGAQHRVNNRRRIYQRHLLTGGTAICGRCGTSMVVQTARARTDRHHQWASEAYVCPDRKRGGCNRNSIVKADLDQYITELVQFSFLGSDVAKALARQKEDPRTPLLNEIGSLQRELDQFDKDYGGGKISKRRWHTVTSELEARLRTAETKLRSVPTDGVTIGTSADAIIDEWETYTIPQKQRVIRLLWSEVRVLPANHADVERRPLRKFKGAAGRRTFDPRRVQFVSASGEDRMAIDDKVIAGLIEAVCD